jgi:ATP-dependent RNA helicase RhlB
MDFQRFGIDSRLAQAAEGLPTSFFFHEKMLTHVVTGQENVCVKIALDNGREEVLLLPALQWLLSGEGRKALVAVPDPESAERCASAIRRLGSGAGIGICLVLPSGIEGVAPGLEGDPGSQVLIGGLEDLLATPEIELRSYGFVVVDGLDRLGDLPSETIRKFGSALLPSWERRSVLACSRFTVKAKNMAWDLADNPSELSIEGEAAKAQSVLKETWNVPVESKLKFLLGLLAREKPSRLCVFCNLRDTALDLARRLSANGISTDSITGPLPPERQFALVEKFRAGDSTCLLLTDEGAEGLSPGAFPLIVNYDIPLEPEFFVKRLEMLDRSDPRAKVVSIACDRYIFGLPAVEQYIDAKLEALPADEAMLSAVDRSEGMSADRRPKGEGYSRDGRRQQPPRRDGRPRDSRPRESYPRDQQSRDSYPREGRSPDIRKSISEATGGALDMSGPLPPDSGNRRNPQARPAQAGAPAAKAQQRGEPRRGQRQGEGRQGGRKDGRRDEARREAKQGQPRQGQGQGRGGPGPRNPQKQGQGGSPGNPYDMPMEERMKVYREKYGQGIGGQGQGKAQGGASKGGQQPPREGLRGQSRKGANQGNPHQGNPHQGGPNQGASRKGGPRPEQRKVPGSQAEPARSPIKPSEETGRKPGGLVSRLFGGLKKKKE